MCGVLCCVQAYLKADEAVLSQHCTPGCVQRLSGIIKAEVIDEVGWITVLLILENEKVCSMPSLHDDVHPCVLVELCRHSCSSMAWLRRGKPISSGSFGVL